jgi:hypothetical protein
MALFNRPSRSSFCSVILLCSLLAGCSSAIFDAPYEELPPTALDVSEATVVEDRKSVV